MYLTIKLICSSSFNSDSISYYFIVKMTVIKFDIGDIIGIALFNLNVSLLDWK
jgi:hypothetical protein